MPMYGKKRLNDFFSRTTVHEAYGAYEAYAA